MPTKVVSLTTTQILILDAFLSWVHQKGYTLVLPGDTLSLWVEDRRILESSRDSLECLLTLYPRGRHYWTEITHRHFEWNPLEGHAAILKREEFWKFFWLGGENPCLSAYRAESLEYPGKDQGEEAPGSDYQVPAPLLPRWVEGNLDLSVPPQAPENSLAPWQILILRGALSVSLEDRIMFSEGVMDFQALDAEGLPQAGLWVDQDVTISSRGADYSDLVYVFHGYSQDKAVKSNTTTVHPWLEVVLGLDFLHPGGT